jgi:hypothetical protein
MTLCAKLLTAVRKVAREKREWTDQACAVLGDPRHFVVESYEGKIVWQGPAHCKYCARAEAVRSHSGESASSQCTFGGS